MIARIWNGWTTPADADRYEGLLRDDILPGIAAMGIQGYRGAEVLRRDEGDEVAFMTILRFDTLDAVRALAGDDQERAHVPDRARVLLTRYDERVLHFESRIQRTD